MIIHSVCRNKYAVSEVIGSVILLFIAVLAFSVISHYILPLPDSSVDSNVDIQGSISGGFIELFHVGGESVSEYKIYIDGELSYEGNDWNMGNLYKINLSKIGNKNTEIMVVAATEDGGSEIVFEGEFLNPFINVKPVQGTPNIFSSLFSNTPEEDLICYRNGPTHDADGDKVTYIYTWYKEGVSFADLYLPCNTNTSTMATDYTSPTNNASIVNVTWTADGMVGGAYEFTGNNERFHCTLSDLFTNIDETDFSITLWMKSNDISSDSHCLLEACNDSSNYVQIIQYDNRIQACIVVDGTKQVIQSDVLLSNVWYHLGLLWDSSLNDIRLIVNGVEYTSPGNPTVFSTSGEGNLSIGHQTDGSNGWNGTIDEIYVYGSLVSEDQIYQEYLCTRIGSSDVSVIVSEETDFGQTWDCVVIPNDSIYDGDEYSVTIDLIESG